MQQQFDLREEMLNMNIEAEPIFARKPAGQKIDSEGSFIPSVPSFMFQDRRMNIAVAKGELMPGVMRFFAEIGLEIPTERDSRNFEIPISNMPINIVPIRAQDVPKVVFAENSRAKAGITGSDVLWEKSYELKADRNEGETLPLNELIKDPPKSSLYFGTTQNFKDMLSNHNGSDMSIDKLNGQTIVTIYPNITKEYMAANGLKRSEIYEVSGQDEAFQYLFPFYGILGIKSSGKTTEANNIIVLDEFFQVTVKLFTYGTDKLTTRDLQILNDLREMTFLALQKRGMV